MLREEQTNLPRVGAHELRRDRVSDQHGGGSLATPEREMITSWETLERSRLAEGNGPVLDRVQEPAFRGVGASTGYRRSGLVPSHASVYVLVPIAPLVARQLLLRRNRLAPAAVGRHTSDPPHHSSASGFRQVVQGVSAASGRADAAECVSYGSGTRLFRRWADASEARRHQEHSPPTLRDSVVRRVEDPLASPIPEPRQLLPERLHAAVRGQPGHVFHQHGFREEIAHEPQELEDKVISFVFHRRSLVPGPHRGKALAGWASREKI